MLKAWLRFFRIVNLPTVPGDVLVGAAAWLGVCPHSVVGVCPQIPWGSVPKAIIASSVAAMCFYLFGLADNDIAGANEDGSERPIPAGEISLSAARVARFACLIAAIAVGLWGHLSVVWWYSALALMCLIALYNRTKISVLMGLCRGLNVLCGFVALGTDPMALLGTDPFCLSVILGLVFLWTAYVAWVTWYSEGEGTDPGKRAFVGVLVGGVVYLQLAVLLTLYFVWPLAPMRNLLIVDAMLLILLRLLKRMLPMVSAS